MRALTLAIALLAGLAFAPAASADEWPLYQPADGAFSVRMPTVPEISDKGRTADSSPSKHETYIVEYTQLDGPKENMSAKMFAAADQSFTDGGATIVSMRNFTLYGHPAQDVKLKTKEGFTAWERLIAVRDRVYQLLYISDGKNVSRPHRFWNSFSLSR